MDAKAGAVGQSSTHGLPAPVVGPGPVYLLVHVHVCFGVEGGALRGVLSALASDWPSRDGSLKSCSSSCRPVLHRLAMSRSLLLVLLLGSAVSSQIITSEDKQTAVEVGPEEGEDVSVLLRQLKARVEQLEKESKARGQRRPAEQVQLDSGWLLVLMGGSGSSWSCRWSSGGVLSVPGSNTRLDTSGPV